MQNLPKKSYVSIHEAAKKLGVSTKTLRRWEAAGKLPSIRTKGGHRRYSIDNLNLMAPKKFNRTPAKTIQNVSYPKFEMPEPEAFAVRPIELYTAPVLAPQQKKVLKTIGFAFFTLMLLFLVYKNPYDFKNLNLGIQLNRLPVPGIAKSFLGSYSTNFSVEAAEASSGSNVQVLAAETSSDVPVLNVNIGSSFNEIANFVKGLTALDTQTGTLEATGAARFASSLDVSGDLTTSSKTFNLITKNATNLNFGLASTATSISATTGTTTINNDLIVKGAFTSSGKLTASGDLAVSGALAVSGTSALNGDTTISGNLDVSGNAKFGDITSVKSVTYSFPTAQGSSNTFLVNDGSGNLTWGSLTTAGGILPIANGGTNNSTAYTAGSVIFSDGVKLSQDNSQFYWDDTAHRLGIGTTSPTTSLDVNGTGTFTGLTVNGTGTFTGLALNLGSDATGDIYYRNSGGTLTNLGIGGSGQVLGVSGGLPAWTGGNGSGSAGFWTRTGTTLSPFNTGDNITTNTGGTITSAGLLTANAGLSVTGNTTLGGSTSDNITLTGRIASGTSIIPQVDLGSDLGTALLRFNNLYVGSINSNSSSSTAGQALFTYSPTNTTYGQSSVEINPTSPAASGFLLGIGVGGSQRAGIDAEGDTSIGYAGGAGSSIPATSNPLMVYGHNTTNVAAIDTSGNLKLVAGANIEPMTDSSTALNISTSNGTALMTFDTSTPKVSTLANTVIGGSTSNTITFTGRIANGTSLVPAVDLGSDLGTSSLRFNNIYVNGINNNATFSSTGQAVFNYTPGDTTYGQSSVEINPTTAPANSNLLGIGIGGSQRAGIDAEGDLNLGYLGGAGASVPTSSNPFNVYNHGTTSVANINTSGDLSLTSTETTGNIFSATSSAITTGNMIKLGEGGNQTFSGNGLFMDFDNTGGGGNAFTGNYLKLDKAGTDKFLLDNNGQFYSASGWRGTASGFGYTVNTADSYFTTWKDPTLATTRVQLGGDNNRPAALIMGSTSQSVDIFQVENSSSNMLLNVSSAGKVGIGVTTPSAVLDIANSTITTTNGISGAFNGLTTGIGLNLTSTSTALTTGGLGVFDWSPGSSTTATGDLFSLNVGANGIIGNILNVKNNGSSVFAVGQNQITAALPTQFTAAGDISSGYDLAFTNPTASFIKSNAPLYVQSGEVFNSSDLTLRTFNLGNILLDTGSSSTGTGKVGIGPSVTPTALLQVSNVNENSAGLIGKAVAIFDQGESQDIITASAAGVTKWAIGGSSASGNLETLTGNTVTTGNIISASSSALTTGNLIKLGEGGDQAFSGNGLFMDFDNTGGGGTAFTGNFLRFDNAGSTKFQVTSAGNLILPNATAATPSLTWTGDTTTGFYNAAGEVTFSKSGSALIGFNNSNSAINIAAGHSLGFNSATTGNAFILSDGADNIAIRDSITAQTFRVYNTFSSTTSFERGNFSWNGNILDIGTEKGSGGGTARNLALQTDATTALTIDTSQKVGIGNTSPSARLDIADTTATTTDIVSATASAITTGNLLKLGEGGNSAFSGNAIFADIDNTGGGGTSFTGNFLKLNNAGNTKFTIGSTGLTNATADGVATKVVAGTISDGSFAGTAVDGLMGVDSSDGRFYFRYGGAWHYVAQTAGFQIPNYETYSYDFAKKDFDTTKPLAEGDFLIPFVESTMTDGAKHGLYTKFSDVKDLLFADENQKIASIEAELADMGTATASGVFTASSSGMIANVYELDTTKLNVLGDATLGDTVINGKLNIGSLTLDNTNQSLNAIGILKIQDLALGNVEFMNGLITFDTNGNIIAKSITADKYKVAGTSAGTDKIAAGQTSVTINTADVTNTSLIFVTATDATTSPLAVTTKTTGTSFKVEIPTPSAKDINFSWWIVDKQ